MNPTTCGVPLRHIPKSFCVSLDLLSGTVFGTNDMSFFNYYLLFEQCDVAMIAGCKGHIVSCQGLEILTISIPSWLPCQTHKELVPSIRRHLKPYGNVACARSEQQQNGGVFT